MIVRVVITGSRSWTDRDVIERAINRLHVRHGANLLLVHGGCPTGADALADKIARARLIAREVHEAAWDECGPGCPPRVHRKPRIPGDVHHPGHLPDFCPKAGPRRNAAMADAGADLCLAFPREVSWGTNNCIRACRDAGITVHRYLPGRAVPTILPGRKAGAA